MAALRADLDPLRNPTVHAAMLGGGMWRAGGWGAGGDGLKGWLSACPFAPPHIPIAVALGPMDGAVVVHHTAGLTHGGDVAARIVSQTVPRSSDDGPVAAPFAYVVSTPGAEASSRSCIVSAHIMPHLFAAVAERVEHLTDGGHSRRCDATRAGAAALRAFFASPCPGDVDDSQAGAVSEALLALLPVHVALDWLMDGGVPPEPSQAVFAVRLPPEWRALAPTSIHSALPLPGDLPIIAGGAWDAPDALSQRRHTQLALWATIQHWMAGSDGIDAVLEAAQSAYDDAIGSDVGVSFLGCLYDSNLAPLAAMAALAQHIHSVAAAGGRPHDWTSVAARIRRACQLDLSLIFPPTGPWHDPLAARRLERNAEGDVDWMLELAKPRSDDALAMMRALPRSLMVENPYATAVAVFAATPPAAKPLPYPDALSREHRYWHACPEHMSCEHLDMLLSIVYSLHLPVHAGIEPEAQRPITVSPVHPGYTDLCVEVAKAVERGVYEEVTLADVDERFEASIFGVPKRKPKLSEELVAAAAGVLGGNAPDLPALHALAAAVAASWLKMAGQGRDGLASHESAMKLITEVGNWRAVFDGRKQGTSADMSGMSMRMGTLSSVLETLQDGDGVGVVDLAGGFHHIQLAPAARRLVWFRFNGKVYRAVRLPFGLTSSPFIFCAFSAEVRAVLRRRGVSVALTFVDDYLYAERLGLGRSAAIIRTTLADLNVGVAEDKFKEPAEEQRALGILVSTARRRIHLPADRLALLHVYLHILRRGGAASGARFPAHFIRHVVGKLTHLASVTRGASAFMGPLHRLQAEADRRGYEWVEPHRLCMQLDSALDFFLSMAGSCGSSLELDRPLTVVAVGAPGCIASDASRRDLATSVGGYFGGIDGHGRGLWGRFHPTFALESTALLELYAMACCAMHFAEPGKAYYLLTDSSAAAAIMNKGRAGSLCAHTARLLRCFHLWLNQQSIDVHAVYAPRQLLTVPDALTEALTLAEARSLHLTCPRSGNPIHVQEAAAIAVDGRGYAYLRGSGGGAGAEATATHPAWLD